jgi:hypothetical protein
MMEYKEKVLKELDNFSKEKINEVYRLTPKPDTSLTLP